MDIKEASCIRAGVPITKAMEGIKNPIVLIAAPGPHMIKSNVDSSVSPNNRNAGISPKK